jgi:hypothetical protein
MGFWRKKGLGPSLALKMHKFNVSLNYGWFSGSKRASHSIKRFGGLFTFYFYFDGHGLSKAL